MYRLAHGRSVHVTILGCVRIRKITGTLALCCPSFRNCARLPFIHRLYIPMIYHSTTSPSTYISYHIHKLKGSAAHVMNTENEVDTELHVQDVKVSETSTSSGTESEEDEQENSSYAMGYMPLSQDPEHEDGNEDSYLVTVSDPAAPSSIDKTDSQTTMELSRCSRSADELSSTATSKMGDGKDLLNFLVHLISKSHSYGYA